MYQQFDDGVTKVLSSLKNTSYKAINRRYLALFRKYLIQNALLYSHGAALEWLSENEHVWVQSKFIVCRTAIFKLNDVFTNGAITSTRHYPYNNVPKYVKLSAWSKELLNLSLSKTTYVGSGKKQFRTAIATFLFFLEEHGIKSRDEISVNHLVDYLRFMKQTYENDVVRRNNIRYVRVFLSKILSHGVFQLLTKRQGTSSIVFLNDLPDSQKGLFIEAIEAGKTNSVPIDEFYESLQKKDKILTSLCYSHETRRIYSGFWKALCLFILLNRLDYSPQIARCWASYCGRERVASYVIHHRYEQPEFTSAQKKMASLPKWSRELLEQYILDEQSRGQERSTLETQRYACLRFLKFLDWRDITLCEAITPEVLQEFHSTDVHATPEGKKGYNSRIGRFLDFLGEQGLVSKTLRLALPCKIAKRIAIVKILNEAEVSLLYSAKDKAESPIALRDAAMSMI